MLPYIVFDGSVQVNTELSVMLLAHFTKFTKNKLLLSLMAFKLCLPFEPNKLSFGLDT